MAVYCPNPPTCNSLLATSSRTHTWLNQSVQKLHPRVSIEMKRQTRFTIPNTARHKAPPTPTHAVLRLSHHDHPHYCPVKLVSVLSRWHTLSPRGKRTNAPPSSRPTEPREHPRAPQRPQLRPSPLRQASWRGRSSTLPKVPHCLPRLWPSCGAATTATLLREAAARG